MNTPSGEWLDSLRTRFGEAIDSSRVVGVGRRIESASGRWAAGSRIGQWFLAEPDPEVIVIDLRETYTVGPILRGLEWTLGRLGSLADRTGLPSTAARLGRWVESQPLRVIGGITTGLAAGGLVTALASGTSPAGWLVLLGVSLVVSRERRSGGELAETRIGRIIVAAFEPPEPPEKDREQGSEPPEPPERPERVEK